MNRLEISQRDSEIDRNRKKDRTKEEIGEGVGARSYREPPR